MIINTTLFPNPSTELGSQITSGNLYFSGVKATLANGGSNPKLYAPATYSSGSSLIHLDDDTFGDGPLSLMTAGRGLGVAIHDPEKLTLAILEDLGWKLNADLEVSLTVNNATPNEGNNVIYTITLTNNGPGEASTIKLKNTLPTGLTFNSDTPSQGTYTQATGEWDVGSIDNANNATLTINTTVNAGTQTNTLTHLIEITEVEQHDPDSTKNNGVTTEDDYASVDITIAANVVSSPPSVSSIVWADSNPTNAASVDFTVTFSESVTGVDTSDFSLTTTNTASGTVSNVAGSGDTYTVTVNSLTGDGTLRLDLTDDDSIINGASDPLGPDDGSYSTGESYTIDRTAPTVAISSGASEPLNSLPFSVTITFNDDVTGFAVGDIAVTNGSASNLSVTTANRVWTADITPSSDGAVLVNINAGAAQDSVGNDNTAATALSRIYSRLVINEIDYDQGATDATEFVEIKNFSTDTVDLSGCSVHLIDSAGTSAYQTLNLSGNLNAGDYYVICDTSADIANCDLQTNLNDNFIQDGAPNAVALVKGGSVLDTVSYEGITPNGYTETATAPTDDGTVALVGLSRYPEGTDTGNNSSDFALKCITPGAANSIAESSHCFQLSINDPSAITEGDSGSTTLDFTVSLSHAATSDVTVNYTTADSTAIAGSDYVSKTGTVTFNAGTNTDQTISIPINGDQIDEGAETFSVNLNNPSSHAQISDGEGIGTITDDDTAGFTLSKSTAFVNESGTTDTFTVVLDSQPTSNVVISVSSANPSEATVSATASLPLTFTSSNWNTPQTVTVTGVDDVAGDANQTTTVTLSVVDANSDDNFDPLADKTLSVTTVDNDTPGITVNPTTLTISEPNGTGNFTVTLNTQPSSSADVSIASLSASGTCSVSPTTTTITNANWNTGSTFTVTATDDDVIDGNQTCTIQIGTSTSTDGDYNNRDPDDVSVTVQDDDTAGIDGTSIGGSLSVTEGSTGSYNFKLSSQPTGDVEITVTADAQTEVSGDGGTNFSNSVVLTFTNGNWNTDQTITVRAIDDTAIEGSHTGTI